MRRWNGPLAGARRWPRPKARPELAKGEEDGDLIDALVDSIASLAEDGVVWLLVPKSGRPGHVEPGDVTEAAPTAGLQQTSSISAAKDWSGIRLVTPKAARTRR